MNNENTPYRAPANAYISQNMTPGLKFDAREHTLGALMAENMRSEKNSARLAGVPKPSGALGTSWPS